MNFGSAVVVVVWLAAAAVSGQQPAERWWSHVTFLANDSMKGRDTGSPEHQIVKRWRTERYHAPSDDLNQPIDRKSAEDFGKVYLAVVAEVANRPTRPQWNQDSFFKRFAQ
jgi:hypothetical protein